MQQQTIIYQIQKDYEKANLLFEFKLYFSNTEERVKYAEEICKKNNIKIIDIENLSNIDTDFDVAILKVKLQPRTGEPFYHFCLAYKEQGKLYFVDTLHSKQCINKIKTYFEKENIEIKNKQKIQFGNFGCLEFSIDLAKKIRDLTKNIDIIIEKTKNIDIIIEKTKNIDILIEEQIEKFQEDEQNNTKFMNFAIENIRNNINKAEIQK